MQSHLWMIMITVVTAVVALAAALVVTAPVLMIVDSSTLDRKDGVDHWRRVTASFLYFGSLGVALWKAAKSSPTPEVVYPCQASYTDSVDDARPVWMNGQHHCSHILCASGALL